MYNSLILFFILFCLIGKTRVGEVTEREEALYSECSDFFQILRIKLLYLYMYLVCVLKGRDHYMKFVVQFVFVPLLLIWRFWLCKIFLILNMELLQKNVLWVTYMLMAWYFFYLWHITNIMIMTEINPVQYHCKVIIIVCLFI